MAGRGRLAAAAAATLAVRGVADAELGGVLVGAGVVADELDAVVRYIGRQILRRHPNVMTAVGDLLDDGIEGLDVGGWATEKEERYGVLGGGIPRDGVRDANRNDLIQARLGDGVAAGICANLESVEVSEF